RPPASSGEPRRLPRWLRPLPSEPYRKASEAAPWILLSLSPHARSLLPDPLFSFFLPDSRSFSGPQPVPEQPLYKRIFHGNTAYLILPVDYRFFSKNSFSASIAVSSSSPS